MQGGDMTQCLRSTQCGQPGHVVHWPLQTAAARRPEMTTHPLRRVEPCQCELSACKRHAKETHRDTIALTAGEGLGSASPEAPMSPPLPCMPMSPQPQQGLSPRASHPTDRQQAACAALQHIDEHLRHARVEEGLARAGAGMTGSTHICSRHTSGLRTS